MPNDIWLVFTKRYLRFNGYTWKRFLHSSSLKKHGDLAGAIIFSADKSRWLVWKDVICLNNAYTPSTRIRIENVF